MTLPAHPCRAILLVAVAACALLLSAASVRAEAGKSPASSSSDAAVAAVGKHTASFFAVPEPGVLVSLAGGVGVLLGLQRFRRRG